MAADSRSTQDYVTELLDIPESWQLEAILSLGMPTGAPEHREFDETLIEKVYGKNSKTHNLYNHQNLNTLSKN